MKWSKWEIAAWIVFVLLFIGLVTINEPRWVVITLKIVLFADVMAIAYFHEVSWDD